jgi:hypothetical protein
MSLEKLDEAERKHSLETFSSRFSRYFLAGNKEMFYDFTVRTADGGTVSANKGKIMSSSANLYLSIIDKRCSNNHFKISYCKFHPLKAILQTKNKSIIILCSYPLEIW